jgi:small subunit ribosomal protein S16
LIAEFGLRIADKAMLRFLDPQSEFRNPQSNRGCNLLSIRLTRMGAKKKPFYRIVVTEKRSKRDGRFVESVGYYDPCRKPADVKIDRERVQYWIERGAQPSETVRSLIKRKAEVSGSAAGAGA